MGLLEVGVASGGLPRLLNLTAAHLSRGVWAAVRRCCPGGSVRIGLVATRAWMRRS